MFINEFVTRIKITMVETHQIANILQIIKKSKNVPKKICFCFTDYAEAFDCVDHNKL